MDMVNIADVSCILHMYIISSCEYTNVTFLVSYSTIQTNANTVCMHSMLNEQCIKLHLQFKGISIVEYKICIFR